MIDRNKIELLNSLATSKNPDPLSMFIKMFMQEAPKYISEILKTDSCDVMKRTSHTLKSSAENMGAHFMADLCREIEDFSKGGHFAEAKSCAEKLATEFKTVKVELESLVLK